MPRKSLLLVALVISTTLTLTACATNKFRLEQAGIQKGKTEAGVNLAPWPDYCQTTIEHALLNTTDDARILLRRERRQVTKANAKIILCAQYFEKYAALLRVNQNAVAPILKIK